MRKARENLDQPWKRRKKYYDAKKNSLSFNVGGIVILNTKILPLKTVNSHIELKKAKLAGEKVGPFKIINPNVAKLKLPCNMKRLHTSLKVYLLSSYKSNASEFSGRPIPKAPRFF